MFDNDVLEYLQADDAVNRLRTEHVDCIACRKHLSFEVPEVQLPELSFREVGTADVNSLFSNAGTLARIFRL